MEETTKRRKLKSCCVTGHRDIPLDKIAYVEQELRNGIQHAIADGFNNFISGFASGADMMFSRLVLEARHEHPDIMLEAALPYPTWFKKRSLEDKDILAECNTIGVHSKKYSPNCFLTRNRYMASTSERILSVYDGREKGGTVNTIKYASALGLDLRMIRI